MSKANYGSPCTRCGEGPSISLGLCVGCRAILEYNPTPEPREARLLRAVQLLSTEVEAHEREIEGLEKDKARLSAALEAIWRALAAYTEAR
jgi:hypothetical protein